MASRSLNHRFRWPLISLLLLTAALGACRRPASKPEARPAPPSNTKASPSQPAAPSGTQAELQTELSAAGDLFNRGENDLACERVKQAQNLAKGREAAGDQALQRQLDTYRSACEPF